VNKLLIKFVILLIPFLSATFPANAESGQGYYLCKSPDLALSLPPGVPNGTVSPVFFVSTRLKDTSGGIYFHNLFKRKIIALEILVEYLDTNGHSLVEIPYIATTPKARQMFDKQLHSETVKEFRESILPGQSLYIIGESFTLVSECPVRAKLAFLHVLFEDGAPAQWNMGEWKTAPVIKEIPTTVELSCDSKSLSVSLYLRLRLSSEGRVSGIQPLVHPDWPCLDNLRKTLGGWLFYPGLQSGKPSESDLDVLLRFDCGDRRKKEVYGWVRAGEITGPTIVVDFVQAKAGPTEWVVVYGPRPFGFTP